MNAPIYTELEDHMMEPKSVFEQCIDALDLDTYAVIEDYQDNTGLPWRTIVRTGLTFERAQAEAEKLNKAQSLISFDKTPYKVIKQKSNLSAKAMLPF